MMEKFLIVNDVSEKTELYEAAVEITFRKQDRHQKKRSAKYMDTEGRYRFMLMYEPTPEFPYPDTAVTEAIRNALNSDAGDWGEFDQMKVIWIHRALDSGGEEHGK